MSADVRQGDGRNSAQPYRSTGVDELLKGQSQREPAELQITSNGSQNNRRRGYSILRLVNSKGDKGSMSRYASLFQKRFRGSLVCYRWRRGRVVLSEGQALGVLGWR